MVLGVCQWRPKPIVVTVFLGAVLVWRNQIVMLMIKSWYMRVNGGDQYLPGNISLV